MIKIKIEVEYNELSDGSHEHLVTIYGPESEVSIPCYSQEAAWRFEEEFKDLLDRYAI